jgi:hypothetical protein
MGQIAALSQVSARSRVTISRKVSGNSRKNRVERRALVRRGVLLLALAVFALSSCGNPAARLTGQRFAEAKSVKMVALPSGKDLGTITSAEDIAAIARSAAIGRYGAPGDRPPALKLVLMYEDGTKACAYVGATRNPGAGQGGWVNYDGIGPVFPSGLFWEVLGRYVKL